MLYSAPYGLVHYVPKNKSYRSHLVRFILENTNYKSKSCDKSSVIWLNSLVSTSKTLSFMSTGCL